MVEVEVLPEYHFIIEITNNSLMISNVVMPSISAVQKVHVQVFIQVLKYNVYCVAEGCYIDIRKKGR